MTTPDTAARLHQDRVHRGAATKAATPARPGLLRRWLSMLAMVGGTLSAELATPFACRLIKPSQASTRMQAVARRDEKSALD